MSNSPPSLRNGSTRSSADDVPGITEAELLGVQRRLGEDALCSVSLQTAESVTARFVAGLR